MVGSPLPTGAGAGAGRPPRLTPTAPAHP
ncbi:hypothetical protein GA0115261_115891, partial [Streptomyces sp. OspMP-M43]